jgi:hypothetical protein
MKSPRKRQNFEILFLQDVIDNSGLEQICSQNKGIVYSEGTLWAPDDIKLFFASK